jgi:hypothetical protein
MLLTHIDTTQLQQLLNFIPDGPNNVFFVCEYAPWDPDCRRCPCIERCLNCGKVLRCAGG